MVKITESKGIEGIKYRAVFEIIKENGKRAMVSKGGFQSEKEAENWSEEYRSRCANGQGLLREERFLIVTRSLGNTLELYGYLTSDQ